MLQRHARAAVPAPAAGNGASAASEAACRTPRRRSLPDMAAGGLRSLLGWADEVQRQVHDLSSSTGQAGCQ